MNVEGDEILARARGVKVGERAGDKNSGIILAGTGYSQVSSWQN